MEKKYKESAQNDKEYFVIVLSKLIEQHKILINIKNIIDFFNSLKNYCNDINKTVTTDKIAQLYNDIPLKYISIDQKVVYIVYYKNIIFLHWNVLTNTMRT